MDKKIKNKKIDERIVIMCDFTIENYEKIKKEGLINKIFEKSCCYTSFQKDFKQKSKAPHIYSMKRWY